LRELLEAAKKQQGGWGKKNYQTLHKIIIIIIITYQVYICLLYISSKSKPHAPVATAETNFSLKESLFLLDPTGQRDKQTTSPSPSSSSSLFPFSTSLSSKQIQIIHAHKICTQFQKDRKKVVLLLSTGPPPLHSEKEGGKKKGGGGL
jgi:hypothetical protein